MSLRILHIWEQGISSTLARTMDRLYGTSSMVLMREKLDPYHHNTVTPNLQGGAADFYLKVLLKVPHVDIVHIHTHDRFVKLVKALRKPVVLSYHGSDIRGRWQEKQGRWSHADALTVSTRDLLEGAPDHVIYFPNPVDESFKPDAKPECECAIHFSYGADDLAKEIADRHGLPLIIVKQPIQHCDMPYFLRNYTHLVEAKRKNGQLIMSHIADTGSLLSLEALSCGLIVLCLDGERRGLPLEHCPEAAAGKLIRIYRELVA